MADEPLFISIRRRVRIIRWRLAARRCTCGEHRLAPRTSLELRGVKHRTDGPCYHCDAYGNPDDWWVDAE